MTLPPDTVWLLMCEGCNAAEISAHVGVGLEMAEYLMAQEMARHAYSRAGDAIAEMGRLPTPAEVMAKHEVSRATAYRWIAEMRATLREAA